MSHRSASPLTHFPGQATMTLGERHKQYLVQDQSKLSLHLKSIIHLLGCRPSGHPASTYDYLLPHSLRKTAPARDKIASLRKAISQNTKANFSITQLVNQAPKEI